MLDTPFKWLVYLAFVAGILFLGWNEPLKYRFMSRAEVYEIENPVVLAPPTPKPGQWMFDAKRKSTLDRGAYRSTRGGYGTPVPHYR